jgi:hypothetical protein
MNSRNYLCGAVMVLGLGLIAACALVVRSRTTRSRDGAALNRTATGASVRIEFYGRIVDQDGAGVPGAVVRAQIVGDDRSLHQFVKGLTLETDPDGSYSVRGEQGTELIINDLRKDGYLPRAIGQFVFDSSYPHPHRPDPGHPVVTTLWRRGPTEKLLRGDKFFAIPHDGSPTAIDLEIGKRLDAPQPGCLLVTLKRPEQLGHNVPYDWSFSLRLIDGGLLETQDDPMYKAPDSGYTNDYQCAPSWNELISGNGGQIRRRFYLKGPGGSFYASGTIRVSPEYGRNGAAVRFEYLLNPAGSRALEPDPLKVNRIPK